MSTRQERSRVMRELDEIRKTGARLPQQVTLVKKPQGTIYFPGGEMSVGESHLDLPKYWLIASRKPVKPSAGSVITRQYLVVTGKENYFARDAVEMFYRYFKSLEPTLKAKNKIDYELCYWNRGSITYYLQEVYVNDKYYSVLEIFKDQLPKRLPAQNPPYKNGTPM